MSGPARQLLDITGSNLKLLEGKPTTGTDTTVVFDGRTPNNRTEEVDRAGSDRSSLGDTGLAAAELTSRLVEMIPNTALPFLVEVIVGDLLFRRKRPSATGSVKHATRFQKIQRICLFLIPFNPFNYISDGVMYLVVLDRHCVVLCGSLGVVW